MSPGTQPLRIEIRDQDVSALYQRAEHQHALLVFAHGAGAGMQHAFMASISDELATRGIATLRYQFPYMERGRRAPSPRALLLATVRAAVARARDLAAELPLFAGGKSMGGRMTSLAAASDGGLPGLRGIVFFGFPLHAAGKAGSERADHLKDVGLPMLFLQGTRDKLAELSRLEPVCAELGTSATLHVVEGGDHSFQVLKRSGRSESEVRSELADAVVRFVELHTP
ncbi:MAG: alpha/beta family hydrolase [Myxococcota bacterium]|nr:alpha/beta family hydrolase [Myxococcota bacterium]